MKQKIRKFLQDKLGIQVAYSKYFPRITERKIYDYYCGSPVLVILDVGANIGKTAQEFSSAYPDAEIHSFEPFLSNFESLVANTDHLKNVHCYHLALSNSTGEVDILRDNVPNSEWNSLSPTRQIRLGNSPNAISEHISTIRGDDWLLDKSFERIDLLKTDTEGYDIEVLQGFGSKLDPKFIRAIIIEVGFLRDRGHTNFQSLNEMLTQKGFLLAGFYETCHFENGKCEFSNALYVSESE